MLCLLILSLLWALAIIHPKLVSKMNSKRSASMWSIEAFLLRCLLLLCFGILYWFVVEYHCRDMVVGSWVGGSRPNTFVYRSRTRTRTARCARGHQLMMSIKALPIFWWFSSRERVNRTGGSRDMVVGSWVGGSPTKTFVYLSQTSAS